MLTKLRETLIFNILFSMQNYPDADSPKVKKISMPFHNKQLRVTKGQWLLVLLVGIFTSIHYFIPAALFPKLEVIPLNQFPASVWAKEALAGKFNFWAFYMALGSPWPPPQTLVSSPYGLLGGFLTPLQVTGTAVFFQAILAVWAITAICNYLALKGIYSLAAILTIVSASPLEFLLFTDAVGVFISWSFLPPTALALLQIGRSTGREQLFWAILAGLLTGLAVLNGHMGVIPIYILALVVCSLIMVYQKPSILPSLVIATIVATALGAGKIVLLYQELNLMGQAPRINDALIVGPNLIWHALFRPFYIPIFTDVSSFSAFIDQIINLYRNTRLPVIGFIFAVVFLWGTVNIYLKKMQISNELRVFLAMGWLCWFAIFIPISQAPNVISATWVFRDPFILFAAPFSSYFLQAIGRSASGRKYTRFAARFQMVQLVLGALPFLLGPQLMPHPNYWSGTDVNNLPRNAELNIGTKLRDVTSMQGLRILQSSGVFHASEIDQLIDLGIANNGLTLAGASDVSAHLKGISLHNIFPTQAIPYGTVQLSKMNFSSDGLLLDIMGIDVILTLTSENFHHENFEKRGTLYGKQGYHVEIWQRTRPIGRAFFLDEFGHENAIEVAANQNCEAISLMCQGFKARSNVNFVTDVSMKQDTIVVSFDAKDQSRQLIISNMYHEGWLAQEPSSRPVENWHGLISVSIPAGAHKITLRYHPQVLISLAWLKRITTILVLTGLLLLRRSK